MPKTLSLLAVLKKIDAKGVKSLSDPQWNTFLASDTEPNEIQAKIAEAEEFAEADKRLKAQVEMRNMADQIVYQTRRTIDEAGEKLSDEDKEPVLSKVDELEALLQNEEGAAKELDEIDEAAVQAKVKEIEEGMHAISAKLYEAAAAEMAEQEESGADASDDGVVDADFEVVEEDED